jgi:outer membrane protein OmpA-like peptidoglycan-associated protein
MKYFYIILAVALALPLASRAQGAYKGDIAVKNVQANKVRSSVTVEFTLDLENLRISSQSMLTLTPVIRSLDETEVHVFDPIVITGKKRDKALSRALAFGDFRFEVEPRARVRHVNRRPGEIAVQLELPYAPWLRQSRLILHEVESGCGSCETGQREVELASRTLPPLYAPDYRTSLVYPPLEPVKRRSDTYVAHLDFVVGSSVLLRDYKNNARVLNEVDKFLVEIQTDTNLTVGTCSVTGFASPDGRFESNMVLSADRVRSFVNYLRSRYNIPSRNIESRWVGEDWDGLVKILEKRSFNNKNEVLEIIRHEPDISRRKARLQALAGGTTYRFLLDEIFPDLRRSEYTVNYISRPFNINEAKGLIHQKPCHLSLNEMYLVANTYEKGSPAFNEVFRIALETFPEAPVARINASAIDILQGEYDTAVGRLLFLNETEAWNNLAIAYFYLKNYDRATEFFERAAGAGSQEAAHNLQELRKFLDDYLY